MVKKNTEIHLSNGHFLVSDIALDTRPINKYTSITEERMKQLLNESEYSSKDKLKIYMGKLKKNIIYEKPKKEKPKPKPKPKKEKTDKEIEKDFFKKIKKIIKESK